jgi:hypothetical protein
MAATGPAFEPQPTSVPSSAEKKVEAPVTVSFLGMTIPVPRKVIPWLGVAAIIGVSLNIGFSLLAKEHTVKDKSEKTNSFTFNQLKESQKHVNEKPAHEPEEIFRDARGSVEISYYGSDDCLLLVRKWTDSTKDQIKLFVQDLSQVKQQPSPGEIARETLRPERNELSARLGLTGVLATEVLAAGLVPPRPQQFPEPKEEVSKHKSDTSGAHPVRSTSFEKRFAQKVGPGYCQNPHLGEFRQSDGETRGCWLQIWREWPDGCKQYRWYDKCHGSWDPKEYWTSCVH